MKNTEERTGGTKKKEQVGQKKKKKQEMVDVTQIFQSFILIMNGLHAFVKSCLSYQIKKHNTLKFCSQYTYFKNKDTISYKVLS